MAKADVEGSVIKIETDCFTAQIKTEGYVSGVAEGSFVDKKTGARDLGYGLDIVDFLLEPGEDDRRYEPDRYVYGDLYHGNIPKRYVELPQICTGAKKLECQIVKGKDFVAVRQWFRWNNSTACHKPGSLWEQWLIFPDGKRYFLSSDTVTSVNKSENLFLRTDLPGHIRHKNLDSFSHVYLSYAGFIPNSEFRENFPPDGHNRDYLYQRGVNPMPERMIRAYQVKKGEADGPWLAGMTLDPSLVYEAWCHQREYVCMIQEIGGQKVKSGGRFGAAYAIGWFDGVPDMEKTYDEHKGTRGLSATENGFQLFR